MIKQFKGLKKKNFCREINKRFYTHGEQTTCVADMLIPLDLDLVGLIWNTLKRKYPNVKMVSTGLFFTVTGTCHPRKGDVYDAKMGATIAYSRCQKKAYSIVARVVGRISNELAEMSADFEKASAFMQMAADREKGFIDSL